MPIENPFTRLFFFNDTATTEIYTLSLHDALPISRDHGQRHHAARRPGPPARARRARGARAGLPLRSAGARIRPHGAGAVPRWLAVRGGAVVPAGGGGRRRAPLEQRAGPRPRRGLPR